MTDEQKAKLPRAARNYIAKLEADLQAANAKVYAVEHGETNTVVGSDYDFAGAIGYLPPHERVTFRLANGGKLECRVSPDGDVLEVYAHGKCSNVVVAPRVTNAIEVSTR